MTDVKRIKRKTTMKKFFTNKKKKDDLDFSQGGGISGSSSDFSHSSNLRSDSMHSNNSHGSGEQFVPVGAGSEELGSASCFDFKGGKKKKSDNSDNSDNNGFDMY
eukprot:Awhi_evm2s14623